MLNCTIDGPIATLTLARSERYNAITVELMQALIDQAAALSDQDDVRAVILNAEGKHFSVGADQKSGAPEGASTGRPSLLARRRQTELGQRLMRALRELRQPTICAIQGVATGGGACIAMACDFRVADSTARLGFGEVKLGMNLMWQAVPLCTALIGPARAKRMIMTGALFPAAQVEPWGLLDEVVAPEDLAGAARRWADEYAALPPVAVQMIKRSINAVTGPLDAAIMHMDADQFLLATATQDSREGRKAFLEKRTPRFTGN
ncbi:MAG: enoyl-CoA hydratase/isomerase family protein [Pseudomonadota bacterium]